VSAIEASPLRRLRERREQRYQTTSALYAADPERASLLPDLRSAIAVAGGERAAVLQIYGGGDSPAYAWAVLDLGSDAPRRSFSPTLLARVPSGELSSAIIDLPDGAGSLGAGALRSFFAAFIGNDQLHTWFLAVDGRTPRRPLSGDAIASLAFLAGRCAGCVLHRDCRGESTLVTPEGGRDRFAGSQILEDFDDTEEGKARRRRDLRFLIARVLVWVVEEELVPDPEFLEVEVKFILRKVARAGRRGDPERACWDVVLRAMQERDYRSLAPPVLALAREVERQDHLAGARELYRSAYLLAMGAGDGEVALEAADSGGRSCRRRGDLDAALGWYRVAGGLAACRGELEREAAIAETLASLNGERPSPSGDDCPAESRQEPRR